MNRKHKLEAAGPPSHIVHKTQLKFPSLTDLCIHDVSCNLHWFAVRAGAHIVQESRFPICSYILVLSPPAGVARRMADTRATAVSMRVGLLLESG